MFGAVVVNIFEVLVDQLEALEPFRYIIPVLSVCAAVFVLRIILPSRFVVKMRVVLTAICLIAAAGLVYLPLESRAFLFEMQPAVGFAIAACALGALLISLARSLQSILSVAFWLCTVVILGRAAFQEELEGADLQDLLVKKEMFISDALEL